MLNIVRQIIVYYFENNTPPLVSDLQIGDQDLLNKKEPLFITFYLGGEIRGSAGSINSVKANVVEELIDLTINALTKDSRFNKVSKDEAIKLNIRIDVISEREIIENNDSFNDINHMKDGVIIISKMYNKMVVLLPNISSNINNKEDFKDIISKKLNEVFVFDNYIVYRINTKVDSDF